MSLTIAEVHNLGITEIGKLAFLVVNGKKYSFVIEGIDSDGKWILKQVTHGNDIQEQPDNSSSGT